MRYGPRWPERLLCNPPEQREVSSYSNDDSTRSLSDGPDAPKAARGVAMVQTLRDVWRVHYAREEDGRPRWRTVAELPPMGKRLRSPYDPEMHYSTKRQMEWSGYKVHVTETCDDDAAHLVTQVKTCPAMEQDMTSTAEIHDCLAAKDLLPAEHFVDPAYVDAGLLIESQRDHGVSLEGPVRGVANQYARAKGYEQHHFTVDWEREQATCPQGKTSVTWRAGRANANAPRIQAILSRTDCGACADRALCTPSKDARRSLHFHPRPEYEALTAARARMHDPAWKRRHRVRAGIEGTLSQSVRAFGMRRSRYVGLAKTGLQQVCTAAAMNIPRIVNWLDGRPRAKTRDSGPPSPALGVLLCPVLWWLPRPDGGARPPVRTRASSVRRACVRASPVRPQRGMHTRRSIRFARAGMNGPHPLQQRCVRQGVGRREAVTPGVVASLRHAKNTGHGGDREKGLVRAHEPKEPDGTAPVSRANQAAARERMSRSTRNCLFSRRSRASSSRSA